MIRVNIAFDNGDAKLGDYFRQCTEDLTTFLDGKTTNDGGTITVREMHSGLYNPVYLDLQMPLINANNFLFVAYAHGEVDCLTTSAGAYVDSNLNPNVHLFKNSFSIQ